MSELGALHRTACEATTSPGSWKPRMTKQSLTTEKKVAPSDEIAGDHLKHLQINEEYSDYRDIYPCDISERLGRIATACTNPSIPGLSIRYQLTTDAIRLFNYRPGKPNDPWTPFQMQCAH